MGENSPNLVTLSGMAREKFFIQIFAPTENFEPTEMFGPTQWWRPAQFDPRRELAPWHRRELMPSLALKTALGGLCYK
jgi:hypothetical protein